MSLTETIGAYLRDHPEEAKHLRPAITLANGETVREFRNGAALVRYSVWYAAQEGTPHAHQD